jgi:hypothetical protein
MIKTILIPGARILCGAALSLLAAAAFADGSKDPGAQYSDTKVRVDPATQVRTYSGRIVVHVGGLFPRGDSALYVGTWDPGSKATTETIGESTASKGYCQDDPWQGYDGRWDTDCKLVELGSLNNRIPGATPNRFPFTAFWGGVPYGLRRQLLSEALAANKAQQDAQAAAAQKPDGPPSFPPDAVEAYVYVDANKRQGNVMFVLPRIDDRRWVDRFEVEIAFTPYKKGLVFGPSTNWVADGSMPGPALPMTSQTQMQQFYWVKKKNLDDNTDYGFRVCAVNAAGRTCAPPVVAKLENPPKGSLSLGAAGGGVPMAKDAAGPAQGTASLGAGGQMQTSGAAALGTQKQSAGSVGSAFSAASPTATTIGRSSPGSAAALLPAIQSPNPASRNLPSSAATTAGPNWGATSEPPNEPPPPREPKPKRDAAPAVSAGSMAPGAMTARSATNPQAPTTAMNWGGAGAPSPAGQVAAVAVPTGPSGIMMPKAPQRPLAVKVRELAGDPNFAEVSWQQSPIAADTPRVDRYRVLVCPKAGNGELCGGDGIAVEMKVGELVPLGGTLSARVPAQVPWNGIPSPVVNVQVCAQNTAGTSCTGRVPIQFWQKGEVAGGLSKGKP